MLNAGVAKKYEDGRCSGGKIATIDSVSTLKECEKECEEAEEDCKFFSYSPSKNTCALHKGCNKTRKKEDWASYKMP